MALCGMGCSACTDVVRCTGAERVGLGWVGLGWVELGRWCGDAYVRAVQVGWVGLGWVRLGWVWQVRGGVGMGWAVQQLTKGYL